MMEGLIQQCSCVNFPQTLTGNVQPHTVRLLEEAGLQNVLCYLAACEAGGSTHNIGRVSLLFLAREVLSEVYALSYHAQPAM